MVSKFWLFPSFEGDSLGEETLASFIYLFFILFDTITDIYKNYISSSRKIKLYIFIITRYYDVR